MADKIQPECFMVSTYLL